MASKTLTKFGIALRKHRIERGETLYEMATDVGVSPSYLSGVETGRKRASEELVDKLVEHLSLDMVDSVQLRRDAAETGPELRISLKNRDNEARAVAAMFARRFATADVSDLKKLLEELEEKREEREG